MLKKNLLYLLCLSSNVIVKSSHLIPRKSITSHTYDPHIICDGSGPSHAEGLPLVYSEIVYKELLLLCSATHGARQNVGCFCTTSSGLVHCESSFADPDLWTARYTPTSSHRTNSLSQALEAIGFPDGQIPFPLFCSILCQCKPEREADAWYGEHFYGVDVDTFVGRDGLLPQSSPTSGGAASTSVSFGVAETYDTNHQAADQPAWHNQCGNNCTSSKDCRAPAGENATCTCQAQRAQYQPGPGTVAFAATCLVFLGSGPKREEGLPCPCNSTYVSESCCDAPEGLVWEPSELKLGKLVGST